MRAEPALLMGLMSGTSLDGVDGVLARFERGPSARCLGHVHRPFDADLRAELLALNSTGLDELHRSALAANAAAVIFAHNHPSGVAQPSAADELLTRQLKDALALVDIRVLDHFIVAGQSSPMSFSEKGFL